MVFILLVAGFQKRKLKVETLKSADVSFELKRELTKLKSKPFYRWDEWLRVCLQKNERQLSTFDHHQLPNDTR